MFIIERKPQIVTYLLQIMCYITTILIYTETPILIES